MSERPHKPEWFDARLRQLGGTNFKGDSNLRVVWSPDERRWDGKYKYPTPDFVDLPMECWVLEVWMPANFFGDPALWNEPLCGPFPREGLYGMKTPLMTGDGIALPLTEATFEAIQQKQLLDIQWNALDAKTRLEWIETKRKEREEEQAYQSAQEMHNTFDEYYAKEEQENNADNRVFSFPAGYQPSASGILMPIKH